MGNFSHLDQRSSFDFIHAHAAESISAESISPLATSGRATRASMSLLLSSNALKKAFASPAPASISPSQCTFCK